MADLRFEPGRPFSETEISDLQEVLGRELPGDYAEFVKKFGGAFVGGLVDGMEELPILRFFGSEEENGVLATLKAHPDLLAEGALPIGDCALGNLYVLDRDHKVHYINYYGGGTTARKVADSFQDFIARIIVPEETL